MNEKGNLSINSENFLPIIKKWLYTDKDIFIRELASNACDAVTKLQKLMVMGKADNVSADEAFKIQIVLDPENRQLQIIDNGIGMTDEEVKKYINQIAFSGATDFIEKYQKKTEQENEIIGHFGLGFYSAFMVADKVEIDTLSFLPDATPAHWVCEGGIDYEMSRGERAERGTTITLHLGEDGEEFTQASTLYAALRKYCSFMPVSIFVEVLETAEEKAQAEEAEKEAASAAIHVSAEDAENLKTKDDLDTLQEKMAEEAEAEAAEEPKPLNETTPLWTKQPKDCTDEDYKTFYHNLFLDANDPLFWIHLNMDYPFRLKGILYFPKLVEQMDVVEGEIKLYSNQVYIADNIKEVVPEFLLLLKGVLDCPDLPLNVSRSALQNDGYVEKINAYITKKVGDKLNQLFKNERDTYQDFWSDIGLFIKYGCMREEKLYDKAKDSLLFKTTEGNYETLPEYLEKNKEKHENKVFFVTDENLQAQYIRLFKEQGLEAVILSTPVDKPFVSFLEYKNPEIKLQRIDSDISDTLKVEETEEQTEAKKQAEEFNQNSMQDLFRSVLKNDTLNVRLEELKAKDISAMILLSEESRRMMEMKESYSNNDAFKDMFAHIQPEETLVMNKGNNLVQKLIELSMSDNTSEDSELFCKQVYDLALMSYRPLSSEEMTAFIDRSNQILEKLVTYVK